MPKAGRTDEALLCAAKMAPSDKSCKKKDKWCMMDSGAGCHAANRKKDVANAQTKKTKNPMRCVLADGKDIQSKGIIEVETEIDDEAHIVPFEDLPVDCRIISVKKIVKKTNVVTFRDGAGYIFNTVTRKKSRFVERKGVYFIKLKILEPSEKNTSGSARPGPQKPPRLSVQ